MKNQDTNEKSDAQGEKKVYERPQVVMVEELESIASDCSAGNAGAKPDGVCSIGIS